MAGYSRMLNIFIPVDIIQVCLSFYQNGFDYTYNCHWSGIKSLLTTELGALGICSFPIDKGIHTLTVKCNEFASNAYGVAIGICTNISKNHNAKKNGWYTCSTRCKDSYYIYLESVPYQKNDIVRYSHYKDGTRITHWYTKPKKYTTLDVLVTILIDFTTLTIGCYVNNELLRIDNTLDGPGDPAIFSIDDAAYYTMIECFAPNQTFEAWQSCLQTNGHKSDNNNNESLTPNNIKQHRLNVLSLNNWVNKIK